MLLHVPNILIVPGASGRKTSKSFIRWEGDEEIWQNIEARSVKDR